jgi:cellulose biosynthesis protein BcsQ
MAIISVHSLRGGTGKSNLTANLTATLALAEKRVGVINSDIQSRGSTSSLVWRKGSCWAPGTTSSGVAAGAKRPPMT